MASEKITSADVARLAGVSQSAVSRVFTPGRSASQKTAARVRQAAEQLGYRPNALARYMATGRTRMIGLIVAHIDNQFYPVAFEALSRGLQAQGYHVLMFLADGGEQGDVGDVGEVVQELLDYQVEGIIMASVAMSDDLTARCIGAGIPVVLFNRGQQDPRISQVTSDNYQGALAATEALIAADHTRIAHIAGWQGASTGRDRARGFRDAMDRAGMTPVGLVDARFDRDLAQDAARDLMAAPTPPDAIFVGGDLMAFGVLDCLRAELGISVPDQVSVVGFDDVPLAGWPVYDLTTVRQPIDEMVTATIETLMAQLAQPDVAPDKRVLPAGIVWRGTVRKAGTPAG